MTERPTILLVEDNHITRRVERAALERAGFQVLEAADGRTALARMAEKPALVVLDLLLPDADGFELAQRLRALPEGAATPVIACSGFLSRFDENRIAAFDDFLPKPVEPERLVRTVRAHLPTRPSKVVPRRGHVLVVDDDPAQLKLTSMRLQFAGFAVRSFPNATDALAAAAKEPPDAVLTDALMPNMDGFQLCIAMRRHPRLRDVPVFLHSATYLEEADRRLARDAGANGFAMKTDDFQKVVDMLLAGMEGRLPAPAAASSPTAQVEAARLDRVSHQIDRLALSNAQLARRSTQQAAQLVILSSIASSLSRSARENEALHEIFANTLDACGVSRGALCTVNAGQRVEVRSAAGLSSSATERLCPLLSDPGVLQTLARGEAAPLPPGEPWARPLLELLESRHGVLVPFVSGGRPLGGILLASDNEDLTAPHFLSFVNTVGAQIGQALALVDTFSLLSASQQRYRALFEGSPLPTWVYDRVTRRFLDVNEVALRRYGYSREEWSGLTVADIRAEGDPHPEAEEAEFAVRKHRRKDGSVIDVEVRSHDVQLEDKTVRVAVANDITDRLRAEEELRRSQEQLRQAQKMEAIGTLAAGVAHDINNVLSVVLSYSGVVLDELEPGAPQRDDMREIVSACERASGIVRQLLLISRQHAAEPRLLDLNAIASGMEKMLRRIVGPQTEVRLRLGEGIGGVWADAGHLEQVLLNLTVNARDAMPRGGRLTIETSNVTAGAAERGALPEGSYVMLEVSDTGEGMTEAVRSRIFEPFFTTKEPGKGTGLGLSTVFGIVREAKGHVEVESQPGKGATFRIYLPRKDQAASSEASAPPPETRRSAGETILLVEDDDQVRAAVSIVLRRQGYRVLEAPGAGEALLASERHEGTIELLLADVILPTLSGVELADRLRASRTSLKVLFVSGHTEETLGRYRVRAGHHFLQKPLNPAALVRKVGEILAA